jgi:hypothetical protein
LWRLPLESHCDNIKRAFVAAVRHSLPAVEVTQRRPGDTGLLGLSDIVLWRGLYVFLAGLYLYKMYSILCE